MISNKVSVSLLALLLHSHSLSSNKKLKTNVDRLILILSYGYQIHEGQNVPQTPEGGQMYAQNTFNMDTLILNIWLTSQLDRLQLDTFSPAH